MRYTEKEIDLARRYLQGDCNETQFNYTIVTEKMDRDRLEGLVDHLAYNLPMVAAAKMMLLYIMFQFVFCIMCSIIQNWRN